MANYIIIGGDGKEYGPITAEDLRQWIAEGRLNAQSRAKAESDAEFRTLEKFPEFAEAFAPVPPAADAGPATARDFNERDYQLDLVGCITQGWNLVKENFGILFVSFLILVIVAFAFSGTLGLVISLITPKRLLAVPLFKVGFNLFLAAASAVVMGPLIGGFYLVYLKTLRGQAAKVGDIFAGFQASFSQLFLGYLTVALVNGLCMAPFSYVSAKNLDPLLLKMQTTPPTEAQSLMQELMPQILSAFTGMLPILLVCMIPLAYLTANWMFTQALIIDKEMNFVTAMRTSWNRVHKHWWQVFGLLVITGLLNVVGACACCIGLAVTFPIGIATLMVAYETIFGVEKH